MVVKALTPRILPGDLFGSIIRTMSTAPQYTPVSADEYLAGESQSRHKHEFVEGLVYAMAGANNNHNRIATNALVSLGAPLRGKSCETFNSDSKVRIQFQHGVRFYYPDAMIVCEPNPPDDTFHDAPVVIVEVLSQATRRIDGFEKRIAYLTIGSLKYYLQVEPHQPLVLVDQRLNTGFQQIAYEGLDAVIAFPEFDCSVSLSELYANVVFPDQQKLGEMQEEYGTSG
jgi:Uma2 family endonuclease